MKARTMLHRFGALAGLALIFAIGTRMMPAQSSDSEEISKLLVQAKSEAVQAENDAAALDSFARSRLSWESQAKKIAQMREHVNELGRVTKQLTDQRASGSPWQQKVIDRIDPLLRQMADLLTVTINHLKDYPNRVHFPAYREYVHASYEVAGKTAGLIRDFVNYDEAQSRAKLLEVRLELSTPEKND